jgi:hypothetical protein
MSRKQRRLSGAVRPFDATNTTALRRSRAIE